jgi:hypothetical protein
MRIPIVLLLLWGWKVLLVSSDPVCSADDEGIISAYLQSQDPISTRYRVHGWRWHTMSVLRELRLLTNVIHRHASPDLLSELVHHTIGFNLKGLNRVETKLFFPWLNAKFDLIADEPSRNAFQRMLAGVEDYQKQLIQQGQAVVRTYAIVADSASHDDVDLVSPPIVPK